MYLAVVHLALEKVGLDASLGQSLSCAGSCGPPSHDCHSQWAIQCGTVLDGKHRQAALLGGLARPPVNPQRSSRDAAAAGSNNGTDSCLKDILGHSHGLCMAGKSLGEDLAVGEYTGEGHCWE